MYLNTFGPVFRFQIVELPGFAVYSTPISGSQLNVTNPKALQILNFFVLKFKYLPFIYSSLSLATDSSVTTIENGRPWPIDHEVLDTKKCFDTLKEILETRSRCTTAKAIPAQK